MLAAIWSDPVDVGLALARLGLTLADLSHAVAAGYVARISRTANDARNAAGLYQWNDTVRATREKLTLRGWHRDDTNNFPTVINVTRTIAISVATGNANTGIAHRNPSTNRQKGLCTIQRVATNGQLELFPNPEPNLADVPDDEVGFASWTLLFHTDINEVRSELSLAVGMDDQGRIEEWRERIILPAIPFDADGAYRTVQPDFGPDIDIQVERRA